MVESEMEWFVRFCKNRHDVATGWAENGVSEGHSAYAYRLANMWHRLGFLAQQQFEKKSNIVVNIIGV